MYRGLPCHRIEGSWGQKLYLAHHLFLMKSCIALLMFSEIDKVSTEPLCYPILHLKMMNCCSALKLWVFRHDCMDI